MRHLLESPNLPAEASDLPGSLWISQITPASLTSFTRASFQFVIAIHMYAGLKNAKDLPNAQTLPEVCSQPGQGAAGPVVCVSDEDASRHPSSLTRAVRNRLYETPGRGVWKPS